MIKPRHCLFVTVLVTTALSTGLAAQTVVVAPSNSSVGVGFTLQFTATVTGLKSTAVYMVPRRNGDE